MVKSLNNKTTKTPEKSDDRGRMNEPNPVILLVDDDDDSRSMLKILLEIWKYQVVEAANGIEAFKITERICPDLILMDVRLPHLDGFDITRQIRQSAVIEHIPIIFLSACAETSKIQTGYAVGGNEYLTKPLDFDELKNTLGKYIRRTREILI